MRLDRLLALGLLALAGCSGPTHFAREVPPGVPDEATPRQLMTTGVGGDAPNPAPPAAMVKTGSTPGVGGIAASPAPIWGFPPQAAGIAQPMLIRTGRLSIQVDSLELAVRAVADVAAGAGGYTSGAAIQTGEGEARRATLDLKVPTDRYQGTVTRLEAVGKVLSSTTASEDVGEEFVDVTARVQNARRLEARLLGLLASRTGKLDDVLAVERELARVREEIERYEGRLRYLQSRAAMSTISVTLFEPGPLVGTPGSNPMVEAVRESWRNFVGVVAAGIALAGGLAPVALVLGVIGLGVRRWQRRRPTAPQST